MQMLASLIRHVVTYLVGILVTWFTLHLVAPDELKAATDAAYALVGPLVIVLSFVAVILSRLAIPFLSNLFRRGAGENVNDGLKLVPWLAWLGLSAAAVGTLPSCSPEYPLHGSVNYIDGATGAKGGLSFSPGATPAATLRMPLRDPNTGQITGYVDLRSGK